MHKIEELQKSVNHYELFTGYTPGIIGRVAELHANYYSNTWGFGSFFEAKVATELSDFICKYDNKRNCIFSLIVDKSIEGSITVDKTSEVDNIAHLRWFVISETLRGKGAGNFLMKAAMSFCQSKNYDGVYLWTFKGLDKARHLYEKFGFVLTEEAEGKQWGNVVIEQRFYAALEIDEIDEHA